MNDTLITREGLARLEAELRRLTIDGRRAVAERLRDAGREANPAESADYLDAREEQELLERRIALLEERIASARIVEPGEADGIVDVGERVRLRDLGSRAEVEYELVGPFEADPSAGRLSVASPLGSALLGLRAGEVAEYDAPRGRLRFEVLAVEAPAPAARADAA